MYRMLRIKIFGFLEALCYKRNKKGVNVYNIINNRNICMVVRDNLKRQKNINKFTEHKNRFRNLN